MDYSKMLENLKRQIRVDYDDEDAKLLDLLKAAEAFTVKSTGRTRGSLTEESFDDSDYGEEGNYPLPIQQAIVMLAGHWYENPTAMVGASQRDNPYGFWTLIAPYSVL